MRPPNPAPPSRPVPGGNFTKVIRIPILKSSPSAAVNSTVAKQAAGAIDGATTVSGQPAAIPSSTKQGMVILKKDGKVFISDTNGVATLKRSEQSSPAPSTPTPPSTSTTAPESPLPDSSVDPKGKVQAGTTNEQSECNQDSTPEGREQVSNNRPPTENDSTTASKEDGEVDSTTESEEPTSI